MHSSLLLSINGFDIGYDVREVIVGLVFIVPPVLKNNNTSIVYFISIIREAQVG